MDSRIKYGYDEDDGEKWIYTYPALSAAMTNFL